MAKWRFKGLEFDFTADNPIFDEWFPAKTNRTVDPVLGTTLTRYVHIGGTDIAPYSGVAQWDGAGAAADRTTMKGYRMTVGLLEDDAGRSCQALLADCTDVRVKTPTSGYVRLAVAFEFVSA